MCKLGPSATWKTLEGKAPDPLRASLRNRENEQRFFCISLSTVEFLEFWYLVFCWEVFLRHLLQIWWLQVWSLWCRDCSITFFLEHGFDFSFGEVLGWLFWLYGGPFCS